MLLKTLVLTFLVVACATMDRSDCENGDWSQFGKQDALEGLNSSHFFKRRKECYEHGIKGDEKSYKKGYQAGLKTYCSFEHGYELGQSNTGYAKICTNRGYKELVRGYVLGKREFDRKKEMAERRKQEQRQMEFAFRAMGNTQRMACTWESDCKLKDKCQNNRCQKTGKDCSFDSDCDISGTCSSKKVCSF